MTEREDQSLSDESFILLTDALRAGPGTEPWSKAVHQLGLSPTAKAEEVKVLLGVREELERGRKFRTVKPGPMFTHRVMASLASVPIVGHFKWFKWLTLKGVAGAAITSAVVAGAVGGLVVEQRIVTGKSPLPSFGSYRSVVPEIKFRWTYASFDHEIPSDWEPVGSLGTTANHGLRLVNELRPGESGGLVQSQVLPAKMDCNMVVSLTYIDSAKVTPEIYLSDDDDVTTSDHALAWTVENGRARVRQPSGLMVTASEIIPRGREVVLLVSINTDGAWVNISTSEGRDWPYVWTGLHHLDSSKAWHVGVRLAAHKRGVDVSDPVSIEAVAMRVPVKP